MSIDIAVLTLNFQSNKFTSRISSFSLPRISHPGIILVQNLRRVADFPAPVLRGTNVVAHRWTERSFRAAVKGWNLESFSQLSLILRTQKLIQLFTTTCLKTWDNHKIPSVSLSCTACSEISLFQVAMRSCFVASLPVISAPAILRGAVNRSALKTEDQRGSGRALIHEDS